MGSRLSKRAILKVSCPRCHIQSGKQCLDMRKPEGPTRYNKTFHKERIHQAQEKR